MNDRAVGALEAYDIQVQTTRKGRGTTICDTAEGPLVLVPYRGTEARLLIEEEFLKKISVGGKVKTDRLIRNKEGNLLTKDSDGSKYILKTFHDGREYDVKNRRECVEMMEILAGIHEGMWIPKEALCAIAPYSPWHEYEKHNKELRHIFSYLKGKGQKGRFERRLYEVYKEYYAKAEEASKQWYHYEQALSGGMQPEMYSICHGDYQYHNVLKCKEDTYVVHFERWMVDRKVRDIYLLLRKLMEKNEWDIALGKELLSAYEKVTPLGAYDFIDLYYRLAYPEKIWKIANYYFNSPKAWISDRNLEKLESVIQVEEKKELFLQEIFQGIIP